jgi:hypothetical protein
MPTVSLYSLLLPGSTGNNALQLTNVYPALNRQHPAAQKARKAANRPEGP